MQFSVIIPAKNEQANIGRCLESLRRLDWDPREVEVIVVDNGSRDDTARIAAELGAVVYRQPELSVAGLRNFGAARARGRMLAFLDADCTVDPGWLRQAARYLEREDVVCFGSPPGVPPEATWIQQAWYQVRRKQEAVGETAWLESMNMFVRREAFLRCRGFDESLATCEDYDISLRLREFGKLYHDVGLVAYHFGEARDLAHFFRKELWRGIGNLRGLWNHGIRAAELPSLCLPVLHCLLLLALPVGLFLRGFPRGAALFLGWQLLLLLLTLIRFHRGAPRQVAQIFVLLNVYYLARGLAMLRQQ